MNFKCIEGGAGDKGVDRKEKEEDKDGHNRKDRRGGAKG